MRPASVLFLLTLIFAGSLCSLYVGAQTRPLAESVKGSYVGSERCAGCHQREASFWKSSQHRRALEMARADTVLGRFDGATFEKDGVVTRFWTKDGRFLVDTQGPDGKPGTFEAKYTLGLEPLQQYLIEMPGGRLQAFGIAWDSRPANAGGQRWFDLYPGQKLAAGDPIHWTGVQQTANFMCVDCHVTDFRKGFDVQAAAYRSTWSEPGVGCEACHGPGKAHAESPRTQKLPAQFPARALNIWGTDPAHRPDVSAKGRSAEVEVCGRCHARHSQLTDDFQAGAPLADGYRVSVLEPELFYVDGQMRDEVFNHGSFLQSRMFSKGVSCSDCHDPHTQKLKAEGNAVCTQCHQPARYEARDHHLHDPASKGGACVSCHMPTVTYMVVDPRHDHSFRVPRPDRTATLQVPNACAACHADKTPQWLAGELRARPGHDASGFQTFAEAFAKADRGIPGVASLLMRIATDPNQSAIARASAVARASAMAPPAPDMARVLADGDALVRAAAAEGLQSADVAPLLASLVPLLHDPVRQVRIAAARAIAGPAELQLPEGERPAFRSALDEYIAVQRFNADRGEAHMNLALLELRRGNTLLADGHLQQAMRIDPTFVPAYIQLSDLLRTRGEEEKAAALLQQAVDRNPEAPQAHHFLGLSYVRRKRLDLALPELKRATDLDPAMPRYAYVYAIALDQSGRAEEARTVLDGLLARHPYDTDALVAGLNWAMRRNDRKAALGYLTTLREVRPDDRDVQRMIDRLSSPR